MGKEEEDKVKRMNLGLMSAPMPPPGTLAEEEGELTRILGTKDVECSSAAHLPQVGKLG